MLQVLTPFVLLITNTFCLINRVMFIHPCCLQTMATEKRSQMHSYHGWRQLIDYPGQVTTKTANLTTIKCLLNSVLLMPKAKCMCANAGNFYLMTPMKCKEYMRFPINLILDEIMEQYNLHTIMHKDHIYVEIIHGMYGLPQAGHLANKLLAQRLAKHGYYQVLHMPSLWEHTMHPIQFALIVDNFCVKYG